MHTVIKIAIKKYNILYLFIIEPGGGKVAGWVYEFGPNGLEAVRVFDNKQKLDQAIIN